MIDHDEATRIAELLLSKKFGTEEIQLLIRAYLALKAEIARQQPGPAGWQLLSELKTLREESIKLKAENEKLKEKCKWLQGTVDLFNEVRKKQL